MERAANVKVNFKLNADVKRSMELVCAELGLSLSAAFTIFARKVSREKRIPFDVSIDPLYAGIQTIDTMTVHELNAKLEHSYGQALKGKGKSCDEVFDNLERKFK